MDHAIPATLPAHRPETAPLAMTILSAILLGLLQGATEFLPISSSGHLALAETFMRIEEAGLTFDVALHMGTLLSILVYFRDDFLAMGRAVLPGASAAHPETRRNRNLLLFICAGTIPGVIAGLLLEKQAETVFREPGRVAAMLAGAGLLLLVADKMGRMNRRFDRLTITDAIVIGLAQALAIVPGTSRSGITMTAALFRGLDRQAAARFSFLLSSPIILGAGIHHLPKLIKLDPEPGMFLFFAIGFLASAASGYLIIAFLLNFIRTRSLAVFAYYRFLLAGAIWVKLLIS